KGDAMKAYTEAIAVMESLAGKHNEPQYRQQLAMALNNLANLHVDTGRLAEARAEMDRALALRKELVREHGGSPAFRSDLAYSHHNLGWLDSKTGRLESSLAHNLKAREIREALVREYQGNDGRRASLAQTCSNLGWVYHALRR